jgi:alkylation response protein AidB-like acyl-CoA dehydrogenase
MSNLPDFDLGKTVNDFRHEVREWLRAEVPRAPFTVDQTIPPNHKSANQEFTRKLSEKGWLGLAWPKAFGGQNRSALEQLAFGRRTRLRKSADQLALRCSQHDRPDTH